MPTRKRFFDFLFRTHSKELIAFAWQHSGYQNAEDLVQEAYLRLLQHPNPELVVNPRAFLYKTTLNLSIDHHRRQTTRERNQCIDSTIEDEIDHIIDRKTAPEEQLANCQELERLNQLLMTLPELTRYAFILHRLEGLSHHEVGQKLGISTRNSERRVNEAARHILSSLEN